MVSLKRSDWIIIIAVIALGSVGFAWLQGWTGIQFQYLLVLVGILGALFFLWHRKEVKTHDVDRAYETSLPVLRNFGKATGSGAKLVRAFRVSDNKRFSSYGKVWDMTFKSNPGEVVTLVDAKTNKLVGIDLEASSRDSPIQKGWKEPTYFVKPAERVEREYKENIKPG